MATEPCCRQLPGSFGMGLRKSMAAPGPIQAAVQVPAPILLTKTRGYGLLDKKAAK